MKNTWKWGLAGLLLVGLAGIGLADNNTLNHGSYYQNATNGAKTDASGNAYVTESTPAMDANLTFANIISNQTGLAVGAADSSAIQDTHRMRLGMLLIKPVIGGTGTVDTTVVLRIAIQIRTHLNGIDDSLSTFAIYPYGTAPGVTASGVDTTVQGHMYSTVAIANAAATPVSNTPWSGEITLNIQAKRNARGNSVAISDNQFYYPNGIAIPLANFFGRDIYSPYTSVRVRVLIAQKGAATLTTATLLYTVSMIGTPL